MKFILAVLLSTAISACFGRGLPNWRLAKPGNVKIIDEDYYDDNPGQEQGYDTELVPDLSSLSDTEDSDEYLSTSKSEDDPQQPGLPSDSNESDVQSDSNESHVQPDSNESHVASDSNESHVASDSNESHVSSDSNESHIASDINESDVSFGSHGSESEESSESSQDDHEPEKSGFFRTFWGYDDFSDFEDFHGDDSYEENRVAQVRVSFLDPIRDKILDIVDFFFDLFSF